MEELRKANARRDPGKVDGTIGRLAETPIRKPATRMQDSRESRTPQGLTHSERVLLALLRDLSESEGAEITVAMRKISRSLRIPRQYVKKNLERLTRKGFIRTRSIRHPDGRRGVAITVISNQEES